MKFLKFRKVLKKVGQSKFEKRLAHEWQSTVEARISVCQINVVQTMEMFNEFYVSLRLHWNSTNSSKKLFHLQKIEIIFACLICQAETNLSVDCVGPL